jgi:hypothetical protein
MRPSCANRFAHEIKGRRENRVPTAPAARVQRVVSTR